MPIQFIGEHSAFKLDTKNASYIFEIFEQNYLVHVYYGGYIPDYHGNEFYMRSDFAAISPTNNKVCKHHFSQDVTLMEYSGHGVGDFRLSAATVRNADGNNCTDIRYVSHKIYAGKPDISPLPQLYLNNDSEADTLEILARDPATDVEFILYYTVFTSLDVIARSVKIVNHAQSPVVVEKAHSLCCDFAENDFDWIHLYGKWNKEFSQQRTPILQGIQSVSSNRGATGSFHNPSICLARTGTSEEHGECFGFNLLYSGNFSADALADGYGGTRLTMGINPDDFEWTLAPGEEFQTPEAVMVYSDRGIGEMSRTFHRLYRNNLIRGKWKTEKRPLLLNSWEGCYFDFDEEKIFRLARDAKDLGIELLVMDDGWFGCRDDDTTSLGDWFVNENKLKGGIKKLTDRINAIGMKFGIWYEPEMISPRSELYRSHPDWCIHVPNREKSIARHQYVLDMTRQEVRDNIFEQMKQVLSCCNIEYVKWDFNRNLTETGTAWLSVDRQKEFFHRYVLGTYELMHRITTEFPHILLENCASGGGRFDGGMLSFSPQIWCSDNTDPIERLTIQYGASLCYPPSAMGAHVSENRRTDYDTKATVALWGTFGYELDTERISDADKQVFRQQIAFYHQTYDTIHNGDLYRLVSPYDNGFYCAWNFVAANKSSAVLSVVNMRRREFQTLIVRMRGLDANAVYRDTRSGKTYSGVYLMKAGLNFSDANLNGDGKSIAIYFEKI